MSKMKDRTGSGPAKRPEANSHDAAGAVESHNGAEISKPVLSLVSEAHATSHVEDGFFAQGADDDKAALEMYAKMLPTGISWKRINPRYLLIAGGTALFLIGLTTGRLLPRGPWIAPPPVDEESSPAVFAKPAAPAPAPAAVAPTAPVPAAAEPSAPTPAAPAPALAAAAPAEPTPAAPAAAAAPTAALPTPAPAEPVADKEIPATPPAATPAPAVAAAPLEKPAAEPDKPAPTPAVAAAPAPEAKAAEQPAEAKTAEPVAKVAEPVAKPAEKMAEAQPAEKIAEAKPAEAAPAEPTAGAAESQNVTVCREALKKRDLRIVSAKCESALMADASLAKPFLAFAKGQFEKGKSAQAAVWARKIVQVNTSLPDAYLIIGAAEQEARHNAAAKTAYQRYLDLAPKGPYAQDVRSSLKSL